MTLKEIGKEMLKARNLSTIIEKKKEEFVESMDCISECKYGVHEDIGCPAHGYDSIRTRKFLEKAIRESVEEALLEVRPGKEFQWLVTAEKDGWLLNLSPQVVHDDKVKEFMK